MGVIGLCLSGCSKQEEAAKRVDPSSPESYMNDKAFLGKLDGVKSEQVEVMKKFHRVANAYKKALEGDAKAEKPETQALKAEMENLEKQYRALRQKMQSTVRERIAPQHGEPAQQGKGTAAAQE